MSAQEPRALFRPALVSYAVLKVSLLGLLLASCGLEALVTQGGFRPTPPPEAVLTGQIADFPLASGGTASAALGENLVLVRAYAADGRQLGIAEARIGERFEVSMGSGDDFVNVRL